MFVRGAHDSTASWLHADCSPKIFKFACLLHDTILPRSALELTASVSLESTHTCAVFQEEDSLSGCSSSTNTSSDDSTEPTNSNIDTGVRPSVSEATQKVANDNKEIEESWD